MKNITETKVTNHKRGERNCGWRKGVIFTEISNINLIDDWFSKHDISRLEFRCATWNWLVRKHTEIVARVIRRHFGISEEVKISWSAYAGCSCPCSKGYVISTGVDSNYPYFQQWVWMDVMLENTDIHELKTIIALADGRLKKELYRRANPPAVEVQLDLTTTVDYRAE